MTNKQLGGEWARSRDAVPKGMVQTTVYNNATNERVATVFGDESHADLLIEAGAIANETVMTPRQLAEHRMELLDDFQAILDALADYPMQDDYLASQCRTALAKATWWDA